MVLQVFWYGAAGIVGMLLQELSAWCCRYCWHGAAGQRRFRPPHRIQAFQPQQREAERETKVTFIILNLRFSFL